MSQIRFNIGVPRGGSAARSAEDGSEARPQSMRPQGGSAARMAEERNRLEGVPTRRSVSISLRAQGGRPADAMASPSEAVPTATVMRHESESAPSALSRTPVPPAATLSADSIVKEPVSSQPPHTVVARIQSLAKSLFSPGGPSNQPN